MFGVFIAEADLVWGAWSDYNDRVTTNISLSDNSKYQRGEVVNTFVDDDGVVVNEVFIGEWSHKGWFYIDCGTHVVDANTTSGNMYGHARFFIDDLPRGVDLNFTLYRNAWQISGLMEGKGTSNILSYDNTTGFEGRTQDYCYGSSENTLSSYSDASLLTYNKWADKTYSGDYLIQLLVWQTHYYTLIDASKTAYVDIRFWAYSPSISVTAYMTSEQYSSYLESLEDNEYKEEQLNTSKNILEQITDFFGSFFDNITTAISGLFIPEEGYFEDFFSRLNDFFSEKLGMLYTPVDMLIELLECIGGSSGTTGLVFPQLEFNGYVIIEEQTVDLQSIADNFAGLQDALYFGTDVIMVGGVLMLLQNKLKEVLVT